MCSVFKMFVLLLLATCFVVSAVGLKTDEYDIMLIDYEEDEDNITVGPSVETVYDDLEEPDSPYVETPQVAIAPTPTPESPTPSPEIIVDDIEEIIPPVFEPEPVIETMPVPEVGLEEMVTPQPDLGPVEMVPPVSDPDLEEIPSMEPTVMLAPTPEPTAEIPDVEPTVEPVVEVLAPIPEPEIESIDEPISLPVSPPPPVPVSPPPPVPVSPPPPVPVSPPPPVPVSPPPPVPLSPPPPVPSSPPPPVPSPPPPAPTPPPPALSPRCQQGFDECVARCGSPDNMDFICDDTGLSISRSCNCQNVALPSGGTGDTPPIFAEEGDQVLSCPPARCLSTTSACCEQFKFDQESVCETRFREFSFGGFCDVDGDGLASNIIVQPSAGFACFCP